MRRALCQFLIRCTLIQVADTPTFIGCCGWTESQSRYVATFPTIELQTPFYQPPTVAVAKRWKALASADFRFCLKAWQLITHTPASPTYRRLRSPISLKESDLYGNFRPTEQVALAWERTREIANILDARIIVFQCPKSFLPTRENTRHLAKFFQAIDRDCRLFAWEPRGEDWHPELVQSLCSENQLIHCVDPFQSESAHGGTLYWRLHGRTGYRYQYTEEDLLELRRKLAIETQQVDAGYVMFNNMFSKQDAVRFGNVSNSLGTLKPRPK